MFDQTHLRVRDYGARMSMAPHDHDAASLSIVVHGGFLERIGRGERTYARGHIAFCPMGVTHSQTFGAAGARQVTFRPQDSWIDYLADCRVALQEAPCISSATFRRLGDRLLQEIGAGDAFSAVACEGMMLEIVAAFGRGWSAETVRTRPPAWLCAARDFIHEHALSPLSLDEIAQAAGRHEIHLAREFRRHFGASVGAYLRRLRIEQAAKLLLQAEPGISAVALDCGFSSHSHLCREFKAHFGVTPSQYRARNAR